MAFNPNFNPNCGACGGLNSRGYCGYTACRFPMTITGVVDSNGNYTVAKPLTHYDEIRTMSIEQMAEFLNNGRCPPGKAVTELCYDEDGGSLPDACKLCWLNYLKQEAGHAD